MAERELVTSSELSQPLTEHGPMVAFLAASVAIFGIAGVVWAFFLGEMLIVKVVGIVAAGMIAGLIFVEPFMGLCLFVFLMPTENTLAFSSSLTLVKCVGVLTFTSTLVHAATGRTRIRFDRHVAWIFALACWAGVSFLWSRTLVPALSFFSTMTQVAVFWALMRTLVRTRGAVTAVTICFIAGTVAAIVAAVVFPRSNIGPRMVYMHGNPNHLARDIVISLILLVHFLPDARAAAKAIGTALGVLLLFSLVLTQSRGCWVGAAICLPLLFLGRGGTRSGGAFTAMAVGAVVLFGTGLLAAHLTVSPALLKARWTSMFRPEVIRVSRTDIWRAGLTMAWRHPVLGVGAGNFIGHLPGVVEQMESFSNPSSRLAAHNSFIETFAELGILGLLLLAGLLRECFRAVRAHPPGKEKMLAWALLLFPLVRMVFSTSHYQKSIWLALVLSQIILGVDALEADAGGRIDKENA